MAGSSSSARLRYAQDGPVESALSLIGQRQLRAWAVALGLSLVIALAPFRAMTVHAAAPQQLPWPASSTHTITGNSYGCGTHTGTEAYAIDFGDIGGTTTWPITAVAAGTAHRIFTTAGGNAIWIDHHDGTNSYYGHMSSYSVAEGAAVNAGTVLGLSGKTGTNVAGIHLHFSMHTGGTPFGTALRAEPMSGYVDFGHYGYTLDNGCTTFVQRPSGYISTEPPSGQQVTVARYPSGTRMDLFVRGINGAAYHAVMSDPDHISTWQNIGGGLLGDPNASWRGDGSELDVFVVATNHLVYEDKFVPSTATWSGWKALTGISGARAREEVTVTRATDGIGLDLFIRESDGLGWHAEMPDGKTLGPWENMGSTAIRGAPTGSWKRSGVELTAFAIGAADHIVYRNRALPCTTPPCPQLPSGFTWRGWQQLTGTSGAVGTEMVGVAREPAGIRLDLFVRGSNGVGYHAPMVDGLTLGSWASVPGLGIMGAPTATWNAAGTEVDAFAVSAVNETVYRNRLNVSTNAWSGWLKLSGVSG
jgi:hypothetical protein